MINWKKFLIPYEQAASELKVKFRSIRKEYRIKNEYSPIEFVTGRVKEITSIIEKADKFNIPMSRISYEMEDIAGIRVMCQFVDDIWKVVDIVRKRKDMDIMYEKDYITSHKPSGYRSYHIIIKYPVYMASGQQDILAEIQIRTLAMNFWATIEHSLNYKYKHDIPKEIKEKLINAADAAFMLDQEMLEIKDEIKDAQKLFEIKSSIVSDTMSNIFTLSSLGRKNEASIIEEKLKKIVNEGEISEINNLLKVTENEINKYKK